MNPAVRLAHLEDEAAIAWLVPPGAVAYVRESVQICSRRASPITAAQVKDRREKFGLLVGYAILKPCARPIENCTGKFYRRIFWLKTTDRDFDVNGVYGKRFPGGLRNSPCEAVDPLLLAPGVPGRRTEACWTNPPHYLQD